jgi:hypothetical protein
MSVNSELGIAARNTHLASAAGRGTKELDWAKIEAEEESCRAFGYLRGLRERALAVEFRYRDGNSDWFPYSWLGPWRYNPSVGLLLKFTGDVVTLVLIHGSNLDALTNEQSVNLTDRGLQRHRITFVREMDEEELRKAGEGEPMIDRIEVADFESQDEMREWLKKTAPVFLR